MGLGVTVGLSPLRSSPFLLARYPHARPSSFSCVCDGSTRVGGPQCTERCPPRACTAHLHLDTVTTAREKYNSLFFRSPYDCLPLLQQLSLMMMVCFFLMFFLWNMHRHFSHASSLRDLFFCLYFMTLVRDQWAQTHHQIPVQY